MRTDCIICRQNNLSKNTVGINKKLLGEDIENFYCMDCLAEYLGCTVEELLEKIEEFKEEGCKLFEGGGIVKRFIYADNAATTQLDMDAFEAMKPYLLGEYGNASQPYSFARTAKKALKNSRETIAQCIGAEPEEIFFTSGGTESPYFTSYSGHF